MVDIAAQYALDGEKVFFITVNPKQSFYSSGNSETIISLLEGAKGIDVISVNVSWEFEFGTEQYRANVYKKLLVGHVPSGVPVILSDDSAIWAVSELLKGTYKFVGVLHADEYVYYEMALRYHTSIDVWTCVSQRVKKKLREHQAFNEKDIWVIPCGIFIPENMRPENDHVGETARLVYVGRLTEYQKRISDLLGIAGLLKKQNVNFHIEIIGDGDDRLSLEQKCISESLSADISFKGWLSKSDIYSILFRSDLLLLTSDFEGMPIAVMEGLSAGCGIISTRTSGVEDLEYLNNAANCIWLNEIGDIERAVDNVQLAINIPVALRVESARQIAEQEFDMKTCIKRYNIAIAHTAKKDIDTQKPAKFISIIFSYLLAYARYVRVKRLNKR